MTGMASKRKLFQRAMLAALALAWLPSLPAATIIIVRHADRNSGMSADALLSPAGEERAKALAQVLKDAGIDRIYVTEVRRTQQTAEPIAARLHLTPIAIPQNDMDRLVSQLLGLGENETALVVGHANTVPAIVERLGAGPAPAMADAEYDRLTVVVTSAGGKARAVTLRYGNAAE